MPVWSALTGRGRALILLGVAIAVGGMLAHERDLCWLGLTLVGLCLLSIVLVRRAVPRVQVERLLPQEWATVGSSIPVTTRTDRTGRSLVRAVALFEDVVPTVLGGRPRFSLHHGAGHPRREVNYTLRGRQRGRYHVGPLIADLRDPLGLARAVRVHDRVDEVLVTPVVVPLQGSRSLGAGGDQGDASPQPVGSRGEDDVIPREYRPGDDTRRIDWKASARTGDLMVRRDEQVWDPSAVVLCDTRDSRHHGQGPTASLEWAVSAALSVALHLRERGYRVDLIDAQGCGTSVDRRLSPAQAIRALTETATDMQTSRVASLHAASAAVRATRDHRVVIAILASPTLDDAELVATMRSRRCTGVALALDCATFAGRASSHHADALAWLQTSGWNVVPCEASTDLATAWRSATEVSR